jgi:hypothetical protein
VGLFGPDSVPVTRYNGIRTAEAIFGTTIPIVIGQQRVSWKLLWYGDFQSSVAKQQGSGGSGISKGGTNYVYTASVVGAVCMGVCNNFLGVWDSIGRYSVDTQSETFTVGSGSNPTYTPNLSKQFSSDLGAGYQSAYNITANDYGSPGSVTLSGSQQISLLYVTSPTPGPGQYSVQNFGPFSLSAVDNAGNFTGTITGGGSNAFLGYSFTITGFKNKQNNLIAAICTGSSITDISFAAITITETDVASASGSAPYQYVFSGAQTGQVVTVTYVAYSYHIEENELDVIPSTPNSGSNYQVTVQYQSEFALDQGVSYYPTGIALTSTGSNPTTGPAGFYNPNGGNYLFSALDNSAGVTINYIYVNPDPDTNTPNTFNLTFFSGGLGQTPWSYLTTSFQSAALGYSEICYVASSGLYLGYAPVLPQYNFEILGSYPFGNGIADANPADAIYQLLTNPTYKLNFPAQYIDESLYVNIGPFTITSVANASAGTTVYTGTITGGGSNAFVGYYFSASGFAHSANDGTFECTASSGSTITLANASGVSDAGGIVTAINQSSAKSQWTSNNFFISAILDSQSPVMNIIGDWCEAGQVYVSWDEGKMKFIPLVDTTTVANGVVYIPPTTPVIDLDDNDFIAEKDKDPIEISQAPWQNRWNRVSIRWSVRSNSYNEDILQVQDEASVQQYGLMIEEPKDWQFLCTEEAAQFAANMRLQRFSAIYTTYSFTLKSNFAFLSPGDIITITDGLLGTVGTLFGRTPCRITKMTDDPVKGIIIEAENFPWSVGTSLLYNKQAQIPSNTGDGPQQDPGNTLPVIFEVPNRAKQFNGANIYVFLNGQQVNWGGSQAYVSYNGTDYNFYGQYDNPGRIGVVTADFPLFAENPIYTDTVAGEVITGYYDNVDSLTVNMQQSGAVLQSVTQADLYAYVTLAGLVSAGAAMGTTELATEGETLGLAVGPIPNSEGPNQAESGVSNPYQSSSGPWTNATAISGNTSYAKTIISTLSNSVSAYFWFNSAYSGNTNAGYFTPSLAYQGAAISATPVQQISPGSALANASGNSLLFNPPQYNGNPDPNVEPIEWAIINSQGQITGYTQPWPGGTGTGASQRWCMALLFQFVVSATGHYTLIINHDDGMYFGIDNSASLVSGAIESTPTYTAVANYPSVGYPVLGGINQNGYVPNDTYVINCPSVGVYNMEVDYFQWEDQQTLTIQGVSFSFSASSQYLDCTDLNFQLPASGIGPVNQVVVTLTSILDAHTGSVNPTLYAVLTYQGSDLGNPVVVWTGLIGSSPINYTLGLTAKPDIGYWGLAPGALTPSIVNAISFGVRFYVTSESGSGTATVSINNVQMTVDWAAVGGGAWIPWANPQNVGSISAYSTAALTTTSQTTQWLIATGFGFLVPFGFVIEGITVTVTAEISTGSALLYASMFSSSEKSGAIITQTVTGAAKDYYFGNITDLWGDEGLWDIDTLNSEGFGVAFQMVGGALTNCSIRNVRITLTGSSATNLELISYENVALSNVSQNTYTLTNFIRGVYGSYPCDHPAGAIFARLDQATFTYVIDPSFTGSTIYFKFLSFNAYGNQLQSLADVAPYELQVGGLSPGAIDGETGNLLTGMVGSGVYNVHQIVSTVNTLQGTYGLQNIPSGYGLVSPYSGTTGGGANTPQWLPIITGGGGSGGIANVYVIEISGNYDASAWDYIEADTSSGALTVSFPAADSNPNTIIAAKKMSSDTNVVSLAANAGDTIEQLSVFSISSLNDAYIFVSDGVSNWAVFSSYTGEVEDIWVYVPTIAGTYISNQEFFYSKPPRSITLPSGLTGTLGGCRVAPTGNVQVVLLKNGSSIGTVNIAASATTATYTFTSSVTFNGTSDSFSIQAPSSPDGTFAGFYLDMRAIRNS